MDNRTCILVGTLATAALGGLACNGARFSLLGGRQDGGGGTGGVPAPDGGADTAAIGGAPAGAGGPAGQGGQAGLVKFVPVDPKISRLWRWQACGSIPPTTASALQAIFPPTGDALAVLYDDGRVLLHPRQEGAAPKMLRPAGGRPTSIAFSLDGANLAEVAAGVVRLRDVATGATVRNMKVNGSCTGDAVRFSAEGTHVLAWDRQSLCVWQTSDGALVGQFAGNFSSAGMKNGRILTAEFGNPPIVKSWSLGGLDQTQVTLEVPAGKRLPDVSTTPAQGGLWISPRGDTFSGPLSDVVNGLSPGETFATLWSADGTLLGSFRIPDTLAFNPYAYSGSGALALLGNEVFDVASNTHWTNTAVDDELLSSIDETGVLVAGLSYVDQLHNMAATGENGNPSARHLFGSLLQSADTPSISQTLLSISPDGSRLATGIANAAGYPLLWRVAADFSASAPVRTVGQALPMEVSFSPSTREVLFSGDGWGIYSADDGTYLYGVPPPPDVPETGCWSSTARFSSSGRWLAIGKRGAQMGLVARNDLHEITVLPIAHCESRASFNRDDSLVAMSGPEVYRTSDWSLVWPAQIIAEPPRSGQNGIRDFFRDAQFAPGDQALLVSRCDVPAGVSGCAHELRAVSDGALIQKLPEINGTRARFSGEGNWIVSGNTALHVPTSETVVFDPAATLSTFAPNGDIIAVLADSTLARYCRTP